MLWQHNVDVRRAVAIHDEQFGNIALDVTLTA
jgi:hypothetical protein